MYKALRLLSDCCLSDRLFSDRTYPDLIFYALVGVSVGRGTLHLYELVGEPYISMNW